MSGDVKHPDVKVQLVGEDGNAMFIMGRVSHALRKAGYGDEVAEFMREATSGDYANVIATAARWVNVS